MCRDISNMKKNIQRDTGLDLKKPLKYNPLINNIPIVLEFEP